MTAARGFAIVAVAFSLLATACSSGSDQANDPATRATAPPGREECSIDETLTLLRSGLLTYDHEPAGSYGDVDDQAQVAVRGFAASVQRTLVNGAWFTELRLAQVADIEGQPRADVAVVAYESSWADSAVPDPIADSIELFNVHVIAFVNPWSGRRGGWNPGIEGLYISCDLNAPMHAVIEDGRGPSDPANPPLDQLAAVVFAERARREAMTGGPSPGSEYTPEELRTRREQALASDPRLAQSIRDALVSLANGGDAINDLPLARQVALGLGSKIDVIAPRDSLQDFAVWSIERPEGYAEFAGPFSVLDTLARAQTPGTQVVVGDHPHCAGDPLPRPEGFEHHALVSIQPAEGTIGSCISWFGVEVFLNPQTLAIDGITLNLFGP